MNPTLEILQGELERLFTMSELADVTANLLGFDPEDFGGTSAGKAAFVRQLVARCAQDQAVEALADAVHLSKSGMVDPRLKQVFRAGEDPELEAGTDVGPFEVVETLGPFSLGTSYVAKRAADDEEGGDDVVVRLDVVESALASDRKAVNRYLTVQRAVGRIDDPGLPRVVAVGLLDGVRPWTAMEPPADTKSLAEVLGGEPMDFTDARPYLRGVLDALEALHKKGLAHGDLKAENVLVSTSEGGPPEVLLTGLGSSRLLARPLRDGTGPMPGAGTPRCMAPEQARGQTPDRRTDLYAFGAMIYEIVSGKAVFSGRSPVDVVARHLTDDPRPPSAQAPKDSVPEDLDALILDLLKKDGLRRPKDVSAVREAVESCARAHEKATREYEGSVEDVEAAIELLREAPADGEAAAAVEAAAEAAGAWHEAVEGFQEALDTLDDDAETSKGLLFRLARIHQTELDDPEMAEQIYRRVLDIDSEDPVAEAAIEELKRVTGKYDEVVELLVQRAERETDPGEKATALREVARIYETETEQPDQAFAVLLAALELGQDEEIFEDLARLAGQTGQWNDLVQACSALVGKVQDPPTVVMITTRMGEWYGERLGRYDYALPCYQQALSIDGSNDAALAGMEEVFRRQQQWPELAQVVLSRADASRYPADRRDRLAEAAGIFADRLSDPTRAVELYNMILADDPAHEAAVEALERIHVRTESWEQLVKLYKAKDEALTDTALKAETRYFIAETYEDRIGSDALALVAYEDVLDADPHHMPTLKGLERLQAKTGAFRDLLGTLATELEIAATPRQRVDLLRRRAEILEEEFHEREEALGEWEQLLDIEPSLDEGLNARERLLKALERFEELDETYAKHIDVAEDKARKAQLLRERAAILAERLEDHSQAAEVLRGLSDLAPEDSEVLDSLARECLASDEHEGCVDALKRLAAVTEDKTKLATVWVRIGEIYEKELVDIEEAEAAYRHALDADKNNVAAAAALQERYAERGDMTSALAMLERQLEAASGDLEKSRLYTEMGHVCRDKLDEPERAVGYYEKAMELDKTNLAAGDPLSEIHRKAGRWDAAVEIYERFADSSAAMPVEKQLELYNAWGLATVALEDFARAAKAYESALALVPDDWETARRLADVYFKAERWDDAKDAYQKAIDRGGSELEDAEKAGLQRKLGLARRESGDLEGAAAALDAALELAGGDAEALRTRVDVHLQKKEYEEAAKALACLVEATDDGEARIELYIELGDLYTKELVEHKKAADAFAAALATDPENRNLLTRLMQAYSATKNWSGLVEVVLQIADLETDTLKVARYYQTAAMINDQELGRPEEAREYYEMAIESDATLLVSFEALARILTEKEEWEDLAKAYEEMLGRLPADVDDETKKGMLDALGDTLQNRLDKPDAAIEYYEHAMRLDLEDRPRKENLARLYGAEPANASKAVPLHHQLLSMNPFRAESYQALRKIYAGTGQFDEQWCCARTLVALHMADDEEEALYKRYVTEDIPAPGDRLSEEHWQNYLFHREQDRNITAIFETILPAVLKAQAQPHKAYDLDPTQARPLDTDDHPFSGMVNFAAATLGMEPPQIFFQEARPDTAYVIRTDPPAILAGANALNAAYQNPRALAYVVGRQLAYLRGGNLMRVLLESGTMMRAWLLAALKHVVPRIPIPADMSGTVGACDAKLAQGLGPVEQDSLRTQVLSFIESAAQVDLKLWASAVDYTADRIGFVLSDDLELSSQLIRLEEGSATPTKERLKELNLYSVSQPYFTLRQKLYISLQVDE